MENTQQPLENLGTEKVKINEPMKMHTYMKVGGPAQIYFEANSEAELSLAVKTAIEFGIPYTIIGNGANILVSDKGINGLVIVNKASAIKFLPHDLDRKSTRLNS